MADPCVTPQIMLSRTETASATTAITYSKSFTSSESIWYSQSLHSAAKITVITVLRRWVAQNWFESMYYTMLQTNTEKLHIVVLWFTVIGAAECHDWLFIVLFFEDANDQLRNCCLSSILSITSVSRLLWLKNNLFLVQFNTMLITESVLLCVGCRNTHSMP